MKPPRRKSTTERDIYCFFDNTDVKLRAPIDAQTLMRKLGLERRATRTRVMKDLLEPARV